MVSFLSFSLFILLVLFWFIREIKAGLFWLYLWQLKEYHVGRFIAHFRTDKGKKIFFNLAFFLKITLFFIFFQFILSPLSSCQKYSSNLFLFYLLIIIYFLESAKGFFDFFQRKLKTPVFTKKIFLLFFIIFSFQVFYLFSFFNFNISRFLIFLLVFDIFTPAIISGIILVFQPLAVLGRNRIIKKAEEKREQFKDLLVVGITGSYGKTSTKEFLSTILLEKFNVLKTKEHQNSEVGISQCILNELKPEHRIFVVEMGAYNRGGIKLLCDIAKPKIGILTGINEQHLATFGSQENIIQGKYELVESLPRDGTVIFNGDNNYCYELYEHTEIAKRLSMSNVSKKERIIKADAWADNISIEKESLNFRGFTKDGQNADFKLNLLGGQNVENILMAVIAAKELGMNLNEISMACSKIKPEQGGMKLLKNEKGYNIIDSTYSSNPDGVIANLEYLKIWSGKKIIIMPCLIELGKAAKEVHKRIGEKIGQICNLAIITTKDYFREIKYGSGGSRKVLFIEDAKKIFEKVKEFNNAEDVILLQSRVPKELIDLLIK